MTETGRSNEYTIAARDVDNTHLKRQNPHFDEIAGVFPTQSFPSISRT